MNNALIKRGMMFYITVANWVNKILQPILLLVLRLYVARVFIMSGIVKVSDWGATLALFHDEYKVPVLPPDLAAYMGAAGELCLPVLLVFGLAGRFGALGLFFVNVMAAYSYPALWEFECKAALGDHFLWGTMLLVLTAFGPGKISVDYVIGRMTGLAKCESSSH